MKIFTVLFTLLFVGAASAADGLVVVDSPYGVTETVHRLQQTVTAAGFKVIARVEHSKAAAGVGIDLRPETLLIFGKPKAGSLLMQSRPTVGIDLPMKYLVWEGAGGKVRVAWNDPAWIAARHGIVDRGELVRKMQGALRKLVNKALSR